MHVNKWNKIHTSISTKEFNQLSPNTPKLAQTLYCLLLSNWREPQRANLPMALWHAACFEAYLVFVTRIKNAQILTKTVSTLCEITYCTAIMMKIVGQLRHMVKVVFIEPFRQWFYVGCYLFFQRFYRVSSFMTSLGLGGSLPSTAFLYLTLPFPR